MTLRATVVGAGGLGGPIALALGAAGLELTIVDADTIDETNLHRQIQFTTSDLGKPKAAVLAGAVVARSGVARGYPVVWRTDDADELGADADVIVDGTDDPATKFAIADWAVAAGRPYVIAAALRYGGNVLVGAPGFACYRCLFEDPIDAATCASAGVLGPVVGAIGGVAAALALGLARGDRTHAGSIFVFDDLRASAEPRIVQFAPRAGCHSCEHAAIAPRDQRVLIAGSPTNKASA